MQVAQFVLYFQNLKARQLAQLEIDDGCCLRVVKTEFFHDGGFCLGLAALARANRGDDLIHDIDGPLQTF